MYWAERIEPRFRFRNCGAYGERTDEIAARFDAATDGASGLVVQGGINDIAQRRSVHGAAANLHALVRAAKTRHLAVAVADVLPWNNGWPNAEVRIRRLNALLAEMAADEGVILLPFHATLEDPDRPGRMRAEWTHADGDHPSVAGYRRLGERAAASLAPWLR